MKRISKKILPVLTLSIGMGFMLVLFQNFSPAPSELLWTKTKILSDPILNSTLSLPTFILRLSVRSTNIPTNVSNYLNETVGGFKRSDVNNDGRVSSADALLVERFLNQPQLLTETQKKRISENLIGGYVGQFPNLPGRLCRVVRNNIATEYDITESQCLSFFNEPDVSIYFANQKLRNEPIIQKKMQFIIDLGFVSSTKTLDQIRVDLAWYVHDINIILRKNTRLRIDFSDFDVRAGFPPGWDLASCGHNIIDRNFTYMVHLQKSLVGYSKDGYVVCDAFSQNRQQIGSFFHQIYNRAEVTNYQLEPLRLYDDYFNRQIITLTHEIGHTLGVGYGEYYAQNIADQTSVSPDASINFYTENNYYYHNKRTGMLKDPMYNQVHFWGEQRLSENQFSNLSSKIIEKTLNHSLANRHFEYFNFLVEAWNKTSIPVIVTLNDQLTNAPIDKCTINLYKSFARDANYFVSSAITDESGKAYFDIANLVDGTYEKKFVFFKANCAGYRPAVDAIGRFDLEAQAHNNGGSPNEFQFNGTLKIELTRE